MSEPTRILVATRDPSHARLVLELALQLAGRLDAEPSLLTVVRDEAEQADGQAALEQAAAWLADRLPSGRVRTMLRSGSPAEEILAALDAGDYALVVLGEREHQTRLSRMVLGSTVERVIEHAPCAVAVAKGRVGALDRLLLCESGVAESPLVELLADALPALLRGAASVTLLHVRSQMSAGPAAEPPGATGEAASAPPILDRELDLLEHADIRAQLQFREGLVVEEVVAEAEASGADLVVLGANRGAGWRKVLLGDLAREIFRRVDRPVLVARPPQL